MNIRKKFTLVLLISILFLQMNLRQDVRADSAIANLVLKTNGGGYRPDYAWFIAQDLREIGIEITIRVEEWSVFVGTLLVSHDYDMGIVALTGGSRSPDMRSVYSEEGNLNIFGLE